MKRWCRSRRGNDDDIVWELKSRWWFWAHHSLGIGYTPYANVASFRNRCSVKLNRLAEKLVKELQKYAEAEAELVIKNKALKKEKHNYLGIGLPIYMDIREFRNLIPHVDYVEPEWKKVVSKPLIMKILKDANVSDTFEENVRSRRKNRSIYTTSDLVKNHPEAFSKDGNEPVIHYKAESNPKKSSAKGNRNNGGQKCTVKSLRSEFPKEEDESNEEWGSRLQSTVRERNGD